MVFENRRDSGAFNSSEFLREQAACAQEFAPFEPSSPEQVGLGSWDNFLLQTGRHELVSAVQHAQEAFGLQRVPLVFDPAELSDEDCRRYCESYLEAGERLVASIEGVADDLQRCYEARLEQLQGEYAAYRKRAEATAHERKSRIPARVLRTEESLRYEASGDTGDVLRASRIGGALRWGALLGENHLLAAARATAWGNDPLLRDIPHRIEGLVLRMQGLYRELFDVPVVHRSSFVPEDQERLLAEAPAHFSRIVSQLEHLPADQLSVARSQLFDVLNESVHSKKESLGCHVQRVGVSSVIIMLERCLQMGIEQPEDFIKFIISSYPEAGAHDLRGLLERLEGIHEEYERQRIEGEARIASPAFTESVGEHPSPAQRVERRIERRYRHALRRREYYRQFLLAAPYPANRRPREEVSLVDEQHPWDPVPTRGDGREPHLERARAGSSTIARWLEREWSTPPVPHPSDEDWKPEHFTKSRERGERLFETVVGGESRISKWLIRKWLRRRTLRSELGRELPHLTEGSDEWIENRRKYEDAERDLADIQVAIRRSWEPDFQPEQLGTRTLLDSYPQYVHFDQRATRLGKLRAMKGRPEHAEQYLLLLREYAISLLHERLRGSHSASSGFARRVFDAAEPLLREISKVAFQGGQLHDIGKIGSPSAVLNHDKKLTAEQQKDMGLHPVFGAYVLELISPLIALIIQFHHKYFEDSDQRYQTTRWARSIQGQDLLLMARATSTGDGFDAMGEGRYYRDEQHDEGPAEIGERQEAELDACSQPPNLDPSRPIGKGLQFDPTHAEQARRHLGHIRKLQPADVDALVESMDLKLTDTHEFGVAEVQMLHRMLLLRNASKGLHALVASICAESLLANLPVDDHPLWATVEKEAVRRGISPQELRDDPSRFFLTLPPSHPLWPGLDGLIGKTQRITHLAEVQPDGVGLVAQSTHPLWRSVEAAAAQHASVAKPPAEPPRWSTEHVAQERPVLRHPVGTLASLPPTHPLRTAVERLARTGRLDRDGLRELSRAPDVFRAVFPVRSPLWATIREEAQRCGIDERTWEAVLQLSILNAELGFISLHEDVDQQQKSPEHAGYRDDRERHIAHSIRLLGCLGNHTWIKFLQMVIAFHHAGVNSRATNPSLEFIREVDDEARSLERYMESCGYLPPSIASQVTVAQLVQLLKERKREGKITAQDTAETTLSQAFSRELLLPERLRSMTIADLVEAIKHVSVDDARSLSLADLFHRLGLLDEAEYAPHAQRVLRIPIASQIHQTLGAYVHRFTDDGLPSELAGVRLAIINWIDERKYGAPKYDWELLRTIRTTLENDPQAMEQLDRSIPTFRWGGFHEHPLQVHMGQTRLYSLPQHLEEHHIGTIDERGRTVAPEWITQLEQGGYISPSELEQMHQHLRRIGQQLLADKETAADLASAAYFHDFGKIGRVNAAYNRGRNVIDLALGKPQHTGRRHDRETIRLFLKVWRDRTPLTFDDVSTISPKVQKLKGDVAVSRRDAPVLSWEERQRLFREAFESFGDPNDPRQSKPRTSVETLKNILDYANREHEHDPTTHAPDGCESCQRRRFQLGLIGVHQFPLDLLRELQDEIDDILQVEATPPLPRRDGLPRTREKGPLAWANTLLELMLSGVQTIPPELAEQAPSPLLMARSNELLRRSAAVFQRRVEQLVELDVRTAQHLSTRRQLAASGALAEDRRSAPLLPFIDSAFLLFLADLRAKQSNVEKRFDAGFYVKLCLALLERARSLRSSSPERTPTSVPVASSNTRM